MLSRQGHLGRFKNHRNWLADILFNFFAARILKIIRYELRDDVGILVSEEEFKVGEEWEWHPEAKKLSDNNIDPLEERSFNFSSEMKERGNYRLSLTVTKHRMNESTAEYNRLGADYPLFISVFKREYRLTVD